MTERRSSRPPEPDRQSAWHANSNVAGAAHADHLPSPTEALGLSLDDGTILRWFFRLVLIAALAVIALDYREASLATNAEAYEPAWPTTHLPPALSDGKPEAPPHEITSSPESLKTPMRFELQPGGTLLAEGTIDPGAAERFEREIAERGEYVATVSLDSPGGAVEDALRISRLIRQNGYATRVAEGALCASSCPLVMAGGVERHAEEGAVVGIHQVYGTGDGTMSAAHAMAEAQQTTARIARHLSEMGIDPGFWLHALETAPDRLYYLTPQEMADLSVTTDPA